jgi:hypothetical protein
MQAIDTKLKSRIYGTGRGAAFTPNDFLDLGGRDAVDKALSRLAAKGTIRRLARGLYEYPREQWRGNELGNETAPAGSGRLISTRYLATL